jgi:hypothetical protein
MTKMNHEGRNREDKVAGALNDEYSLAEFVHTHMENEIERHQKLSVEIDNLDSDWGVLYSQFESKVKELSELKKVFYKIDVRCKHGLNVFECSRRCEGRVEPEFEAHMNHYRELNSILQELKQKLLQMKTQFEEKNLEREKIRQRNGLRNI